MPCRAAENRTDEVKAMTWELARAIARCLWVWGFKIEQIYEILIRLQTQASLRELAAYLVDCMQAGKEPTAEEVYEAALRIEPMNRADEPSEV